MATTGRAGVTVLLTTRSLGRRGNRSRSRRGRCATLLGLAFKELTFTETQLGAQLLDLLLGVVAAGNGVVMHGTPIADLLTQLQELGSTGAIRGETGHRDRDRFVEPSGRNGRGESILIHSPVVTETTGASQVSRWVYRMRTFAAIIEKIDVTFCAAL